MLIADEIEALIQERPMLKHPFYQSWTAGTLSKQALSAYAAQYFRQVDAFPRYVSGVHTSCDNLKVRQYLLGNLNEEEQGDDNHPALWLRFAAALGVCEDDVRSAKPWPETMAMVENFTALTRDPNYRKGLSALLAYESQIPGVSKAKIEGLKAFYGIDSADAVKFFSVHLDADVWHSQVSRDLLNEHTRPADRDGVLASAGRARDAMWGFLDGALREAMAA